MALKFKWDERKAVANLEKHGVSFEEAATAFADPLSLTVFDPDHSIEESRFVTVGETFLGRAVVVSHAETNDNVRIISARLATVREKKAYEEE